MKARLAKKIWGRRLTGTPRIGGTKYGTTSPRSTGITASGRLRENGNEKELQNEDDKENIQHTEGT